MSPIDGFLKSLKPGEPVFCLRAQDKVAPMILEQWAEAVESRARTEAPAGGQPWQTLIDMRLAKAREARALAHEMRAWQTRNGCKVPD